MSLIGCSSIVGVGAAAGARDEETPAAATGVTTTNRRPRASSPTTRNNRPRNDPGQDSSSIAPIATRPSDSFNGTIAHLTEKSTEVIKKKNDRFRELEALRGRPISAITQNITASNEKLDFLEEGTSDYESAMVTLNSLVAELERANDFTRSC